jgi:hypothetical protein
VAGQVTITGQEETRRSLRQLRAELENLADAHKAAAGVLAGAIGAAAPHRTGALASSFVGSGSRQGAEVSSSLDYAGPVNYGVPRRGIAPTNYVQRAASSSESKVGDTYEREIQKLLRKAEG